VWAAETPDKPAFVIAETGECITYRELDARSNRLAHYWRSRGLVRGDRVAVVMENHVRQAEVLWAALRSGLVFTPINWHLTPDEAGYILRDSGARSVVTSLQHAETTRRAAAEMDVLCVGDNYDAALAEMPVTPITDESRGTDMIYTSGTTGRPKGGVRAAPNVHPAEYRREWLRFFEWFGLGQDSVYLSPGAPLYHGAPLRFTTAVTTMGGTVVTLQSFDAAAATRAVGDYGVTQSQWVPTMFVRMLRLPDEVRTAYDGSTHRCAIHAAAPCPASVKEQMIDWWGPIVTEYYGGSEGGVLTGITAAEWLDHRGSVGRPLDGVLHITDDSGNEVAPGTVGQVRFEGGVPIKYHNDDAKTAGAYDAHGWSTVGDVGYLDDDGFLYLADRADFMINSGGVNIYPQEIENALIGHPSVVDVAVFGVPNAEFGEEVKAVVEVADLAAAGDALAEELRAYLRPMLAGYKLPRSFDFVATLPRNPAGKLEKKKVRALYV
jgi:acyl-CoA synthetase (AMP-forming)/AMP-acid ligase II